MPPVTEKQREMVPADEVEAIIARRVQAELETRVQAEIEKSVDAIKEKVASALASQQTEAAPDGSWMQALAMQIAMLTDQGTGRKRISPEDLVKRESAKERMMGLLARAEATGDEPVYRLRSMVYLGEVKIMPSWIDRDHRQQPTEIGWLGVPNIAMDPVNNTAHEIYSAFSEWVGGVEKPMAQMDRLSPSGLVSIKSGPMTERMREPEQTGAPGSRGSLSPTIRGRTGAGPVVERRILGTVMPPAREQP